MELRQLVYVEAVARCGGFSRAAEQLHIAQPAVSAQVKRLETELGVTLFERTTRRVTPTHAGELFLARTRRVLEHLDGARADLNELAAVVRGRINIGATEVLSTLDLPGSLATFHRRYPGVAMTLRTGLIAHLIDELRAGTLDVVLGPLHDDLPDDLVTRSLAVDTLVLVTPPGRGRATVTPLATVRDEPFVSLPAGSGLRTILVAAAEAEGFTPRIPFETHSPVSIRELVAAGLGVALLAESVARGPGPAIDVHALCPAPRHPPIGMIHARSRTLTPAVRAWQRHLRQTSRGR